MLIARAGFRSAAGLVPAAMALGTGSARAAPAGISEDWQLGFQDMVTEVGRSVAFFHDWLLLPIITIISLFVLALLVIIVVRFNEDANPVPSQTTHNTTLEVAWTIVPVLILVAIAIPSFRLLRKQLIIPPHDVIVKATGNQLVLELRVSRRPGRLSVRLEHGSRRSELKAGAAAPARRRQRGGRAGGQDRAPPGDGADVLHAFAMPSFGIKIDAMPGRLNETWFKAEREGIYYGQCSELCGKDHPYMPIAVRVVSEQQYAAWLAEAKQKFADDRRRGAQLAAAPRTVDKRDRSDHRLMGQAHGICAARSRPRSRRTSDRMAPLAVFHQPQGHRHALPDLLVLGGPGRRRSSRSSCAWSCRSRACRSSPTRRPTTSS